MKALKDLPDVVTIYRGEADGSTPWQTAYSWTLDINVAYFFAARLGTAGYKIHSANVGKEHIVEYFNERDEQEVFCLPQTVYNVTTQELPGVEDLLKASKNLDFYFGIQTDCAMEERLAQNDGRDGSHNMDHTRRVAVLAALICDSIGAKLQRSDKRLLFQAIAYHDTGRTNDMDDEAHGERGYERYCLTHPKNNIVKFLITYHCIDDAVARKALKMVKSEYRDTVWLMYSVLKDADALDRVRFGIRALDVSMLRIPYSKMLVASAEQLLHAKLTADKD